MKDIKHLFKLFIIFIMSFFIKKDPEIPFVKDSETNKNTKTSFVAPEAEDKKEEIKNKKAPYPEKIRKRIALGHKINKEYQEKIVIGVLDHKQAILSKAIQKSLSREF